MTALQQSSVAPKNSTVPLGQQLGWMEGLGPNVAMARSPSLGGNAPSPSLLAVAQSSPVVSLATSA